MPPCVRAYQLCLAAGCNTHTVHVLRHTACLREQVCLQGDLAAGEMIHGVQGVDSERRQQLIDLLDIDLHWRLNRVSDGQRRRVQICMGLLKPYKVSYGNLGKQQKLLRQFEATRLCLK